MSLLFKNLSVSLDGLEILKKITMEIKPGEVHALMGPNGSGKSTLAQTLMGSKNYKLGIINYELRMDGKDIKKLTTDERARKGLFLTFQNPVGIPGVTVANLLRIAYPTDKTSSKSGGHNPALSVWEFNEMLFELAQRLIIPPEFLRRSLNEAFSGGEKKKLEMLQALVLSPKYAIFDEIDTGLDVDALKIVARGIEELRKKGTGIILITHYQRILKYLRPDFVHILVKGKIEESGGYKLAKYVEKNGYKKWS